MLMELEQMITTAEAEKIAEQYGTPISRASIVRALQRGQEGVDTGVEGGIQLDGEGGRWLIPKKNFVEWLETRQPRGRKSQN